MASPKILLTAFEPFDKFKDNSSAMCLKKLKENLDFSRLNIKSNIYPVSWLRAQSMLMKDLKGKYDYLVHLGQNDQARSVTLESKAYNEAKGTDMDNKSVNGKIVQNGPSAYRSAIRISTMVNLLDDEELDIDYTVSDNPGRFLCNFVYYLSMHDCATRGKGKCLFIHLPLDPSQIAGTRLRKPTYDIKKSTLAVSLILKKLASE